MTIKFKYLIFTLLVHGLIVVLLYQLLEERQGLFILSEIGVMLSLFFSYQIYMGFIKPLDFMANGINALEDKDYAVQYLETRSKELNRLIEVYNQMLSNLRQERIEMQEKNFFLSQIIEAYPAGLIILDYDNNIAEINPEALHLLQVKGGLRGKAIDEIDHPLIRQISKIPIGKDAVFKGAGIKQFKCEVGQFIHRGFKRKFIIIQELSKEIIAAEKQAYAKVIRMMAHEVNNSIGAVNAIMNIAKESIEENEEETQIGEALEMAIDRNNKLNLFMRNFAEVIRLPKPQKKLYRLDQLIRKVAKVMTPLAALRNIEFKFEILEVEELKVKLDPEQMEQALVNIVKNAMESIGKDGQIIFSASANPLQIKIYDNGPGIPKEAKEKLFTPFFSTKTDGQGIGLTLVKEIILNHGGQIRLETQKDGWTLCLISL